MIFKVRIFMQSILKLNETHTFDEKYQGAADETKHSNPSQEWNK